jgi:two-component system response regulator GlrR
MKRVPCECVSEKLIGQSPAFLRQVAKIPLLAQCCSCVLISGETGTGKEVCARLIHELSKRAGKSFVAINCGAIPSELVENELFGHRQGAFTGAVLLQNGLIREAEGGTLFLDEIDSLPYSAQVKLLRFLQDKTYRPLGSAKECRADVRIIAASGTPPEKVLNSGRLRCDLYYRINVLQLRLPPLRNRREDIPVLADHFLKAYARESRKAKEGFSHDALQKLLFYDWPGNVRELMHVIERAVAGTRERTIHAGDIAVPDMGPLESFRAAKERFVMELEGKYIRDTLSLFEGNISQAARAADKHRRAFWELIRKHGIDVRRFRTG